MELICPSCEARYQVPDASVGEKGRQVSCMNCGHSWHAFPPLVLGSSAAPPTTASPGIDWQTPPRPGRPQASGLSYADPEPATKPVRDPEPPRMDQSRSEQLAEIREMLAEVQSEERAAAALVPDEDDGRTHLAPAPKPDPESRHQTAAASSGTETDGPPAAAERGRSLGEEIEIEDDDDEDANDGVDPLRRRMAMHDRHTAREQTDVNRLRRRHDRRARRQKRAQAAGSGAFLTGFLLVVIIAAAMTALYVLKPQIIARMPGTEPMLNQYAETIDGLRVNAHERFESVRGWFNDLIDKNA